MNRFLLFAVFSFFLLTLAGCGPPAKDEVKFDPKINRKRVPPRPEGEPERGTEVKEKTDTPPADKKD